MNLLELAKEHGVVTVLGYGDAMLDHKTKLQSFAQAAIEDYKASLVPVGEVSGNDWSMGLLYEDCEPGTPLYMLPKE